MHIITDVLTVFYMGSINWKWCSLFILKVAKVKSDAKFGGVNQLLQNVPKMSILGHLDHYFGAF